jgi:hypothetical protein
VGLIVARCERWMRRPQRREKRRKGPVWGREKVMWVLVGWETCPQQWGRVKGQKRTWKHSVELKQGHLSTLSERVGDLEAPGRMCGLMVRVYDVGYFDLRNVSWMAVMDGERAHLHSGSREVAIFWCHLIKRWEVPEREHQRKVTWLRYASLHYGRQMVHWLGWPFQ